MKVLLRPAPLRFLILALAFAGTQRDAARAATRPPPPGYKAEEATALSDWTRRLKAADADLRAQDLDQAFKTVQGVLREMREEVASGEGSRPLLAMPILLRAIAEAGLGEADAALWDWHTAVALHPPMRGVVLSVYGRAGDTLSELRRAEAPLPPSDSHGADEFVGPVQPKPVEPPKKIKEVRIRYPTSAGLACVEGRMVVDTVVGEDGILRRPNLVEDPGSALLLFAGLEALSATRYKPAAIDGRPVSVWLRVTSNFSTPGCSLPR